MRALPRSPACAHARLLQPSFLPAPALLPCQVDEENALLMRETMTSALLGSIPVVDPSQVRRGSCCCCRWSAALLLQCRAAAAVTGYCCCYCLLPHQLLLPVPAAAAAPRGAAGAALQSCGRCALPVGAGAVASAGWQAPCCPSPAPCEPRIKRPSLPPLCILQFEGSMHPELVHPDFEGME